MMDVTKIHSFNSFVRMMYAYSTPEIARHVTLGSGHFETVTKYPDPTVTRC